MLHGIKYKAVKDMDIHFILKENQHHHKHHKLSALQVTVQPGGLNINTGIYIICSICAKALTVTDFQSNIKAYWSVHPKQMCKLEEPLVRLVR